MINFNFTRPSDENPEGNINISIDYNVSTYYNEKQFPLHLLHKTLMGEVEWYSDLSPGWFSQYYMNEKAWKKICNEKDKKDKYTFINIDSIPCYVNT